MRVLSTYDENKPLIPGPPRQLLQEGWRGDKVTISRCDLPSISFSWILRAWVKTTLCSGISSEQPVWGFGGATWWGGGGAGGGHPLWGGGGGGFQCGSRTISSCLWADQMNWSDVEGNYRYLTLLVEEPFLLDQLRGSFTELTGLAAACILVASLASSNWSVARSVGLEITHNGSRDRWALEAFFLCGPPHPLNHTQPLTLAHPFFTWPFVLALRWWYGPCEHLILYGQLH